MKNKQKTVVFNQKKLFLGILLSFGIAVAMVSIFGKLAPIGIVSYRLISSIVRPLFS